MPKDLWRKSTRGQNRQLAVILEHELELDNIPSGLLQQALSDPTMVAALRSGFSDLLEEKLKLNHYRRERTSPQKKPIDYLHTGSADHQLGRLAQLFPGIRLTKEIGHLINEESNLYPSDSIYRIAFPTPSFLYNYYQIDPLSPNAYARLTMLILDLISDKVAEDDQFKARRTSVNLRPGMKERWDKLDLPPDQDVFCCHVSLSAMFGGWSPRSVLAETNLRNMLPLGLPQVSLVLALSTSLPFLWKGSQTLGTVCASDTIDVPQSCPAVRFTEGKPVLTVVQVADWYSDLATAVGF